MRMLTVEQIQDYLGPDIHPLPGSFSTDITQIRFDLTHDETLDHSHIFSLLMYSDHSQVSALGRFGRLRALKALNMGKAVGPLFFVRPFYKCVTYVPPTHLESVREALWEAGAGQVGRYSRCSYASTGIGTFWPEGETHPFLGEVGTLNQHSEMRLEVVVPKWYQDRVERALLVAHPYEEPAYDWIALENRLGIAQAYCDEQGKWWFLEDTVDLLNSVLKSHPPRVHCEKISWGSRLELARGKIMVDIKAPGELLYPGLQKLWGAKKKLWE